MPSEFGWIAKFLKPRSAVAKHRLKWPVPEVRFTAAVQDAEKAVASLKGMKAAFIRGGEFKDEVYAKEFAEGVYAYFIVRVDKRTEEERVLFEGYMLEEQERLGMEVESRYTIARDLEAIGYSRVFSRGVTLWTFNYIGLPATVYSIAGLGDFLEVTLPPTKLAKHRERDQKNLEKFFKSLKIGMDEILPTDVTTLQYIAVREGEAQAEAQAEGRGSEAAAKGKPRGEFRLGEG
jgi:adenylate cyclase class IV